MGHSIDVEKGALGGTVQVEAGDSVASQQPPPPLLKSGSKTLQPQTDSTQDAAEDPSDICGVDPKLEREFNSSAARKFAELFDPYDDIVGVMLLRRVMEAKLALTHEDMRLRNERRSSVPVPSDTIDAGIERLSRVLHDWEANRRLQDKFNERSVEFSHTIGSHAARLITLNEYEQASTASGGPARQAFIGKMRSELRKNEQDVLLQTAYVLNGKTMKQSLQEGDVFSRLKMAVFGALAFLVPMLIMILHPTKLTTLLTTVVCVLAVAVALAYAMHDSDPKDVLSATAAYTAVLVVFIGSSNTSSGLSNGVVGAITGGVLGGALLLGTLFWANMNFLNAWISYYVLRRRQQPNQSSQSSLSSLDL